MSELLNLDALLPSEVAKRAEDYANLTWTNFFLVNLLPVTLGNVLGGVVLVGLVYWFIYLRPKANEAAVATP